MFTDRLATGAVGIVAAVQSHGNTDNAGDSVGASVPESP
jgi:hypothetical protein